MVPNRRHFAGILEFLKTVSRSYFRNTAAAFAVGIAASAAVVAPATAESHTLNRDEMTLFRKIAAESGQQRDTMKLDPILCLVARQRGADMARRHYFSHTTPDGKGANYLIGQAGYVLPSYYDLSRSGNNIESIGMSTGTPKQMVSLWLHSPDHRDHVLAELDFFQQQTSIGVGVFRSSKPPYYKYYVFLSAPPNAALNPWPRTLKSPTATPAKKIPSPWTTTPHASPSPLPASAASIPSSPTTPSTTTANPSSCKPNTAASKPGPAAN